MEELRLSKRLAELGLCSRREADEYIAKGWVKVDGVVVDVLGSKVLPSQVVSLEPAAKATQAGRVIEDFVDEHLSNWYVRLCRRR